MNDEFEFDPDGFERDLATTLRNSNEAFRGKYRDELNALSGLSRKRLTQSPQGLPICKSMTN